MMLLIFVMSDLAQELRAQANQHPLDADLSMFDVAATAAEEAENIKKLYEYELKERMNIFATTLRTMTNGEWDKLKELEPDLHAFIKQAVNR